MIEPSQRHAARVFAITTLLMNLVIMFAFTRFYGPFLAWEHDAETARNFSAHEQLLHYYIAAAVMYGLGAMVALTALYVVFRPVGRGWAFFAASARLIYAVMWFLCLLDLFGALNMMKSGALEPERLQVLAGLQLTSGWDAYYIGLTFYAIGSVIFAYLFLKSRYIPRALAVFGIVCALFEGVCGFGYLVDRKFGAIVSPNWYEMPPLLFEVILCLWILIRGLRLPKSAKSIAAAV